MAEVDTRSPAAAMQDTDALVTEDLPTTDVVHTGASEDTVTISGEDGPAKKTKKVIRRKRRPARPQVDPAMVKSEPPPQTGTIFNIWYNKWSGGDREDKYLSQTKAQGRCSIARDSGYTRADRTPGSFFCLFFARGLCPKGHECEYLHRLPGIHDHFNPNIDCFGRDKHSDYRDDMGGTGSFMRQNRTLYIGRIHVTDDIEEIVARHFAEWGDVERTRVLTGRGVGFVTYANEGNAQFAKEAMAHQSLDNEEILNVRWATMDPNPQAQKREAHRIEQQAAEAVRRALPDEFVREIEGRDPEAKKRKKLESGFGLQNYEAPDEIYYAQTRALEKGDSAQAEQALLEAPHAEVRTISEPQSVEGGKGGEGIGIFSGTTLAALQGYKVGSQVAVKPAASVTGGLVAYDSDSD